MTIEDIFMACANMSTHDTFEVSVVNGLETTEYYTFETWYEVPERIRKTPVRSFEIGEVNVFVINA